MAGLLVATVALWGDWALGANKKKDAKGPPSAAVTQGYFGDDLDKIDATCTLTDQQKTRLRQLKTEQDKAIDNYDKNAAPTLTRIDEALVKLGTDKSVAAKRKEFEDLKVRIAAERETLSQTHARKMFAVLTADQKAKWNTPLLTDGMTAEFSIAALDAKQIERLNSFCAQQARVLAFPVDPFSPNDKQLNPVKLQVFKTILTPAQQAEYYKIKNPPPPTKGAKTK